LTDSFFAELKRRNVYKVGVAYLVLAWVVIQVTDTAVPALHLPDWVNSLVFLLGAIGLPFALFFAWAFEMTPDGIMKESDIAPEDSITAHTGRKLDLTIIGLLIIALSYFIYESRFQSQPDEDVAVKDISTKTEPEPPMEDTPETEGSSIAVLPFVNMSSDKEQEYFSDGISEEILNVLAKLPHLKVTSRSSAFFYKGKDIKISKVARDLKVKNILEGSVRKFGNRIRITAQLIEAESDTHLWSETYDREMADLFAIQDEISIAIVEALKSKLGLDVKVITEDKSSINLEAYNEYLKGRFYVDNRTLEDLRKALAHFEKSIEISPDYAPAWMGKAWAVHFLNENNYGDIPVEISQPIAKEAITKALLINPDLPESLAMFGLIEITDGNNESAIESLQKAIKINPNYADAYTWYGETQFENPLKQIKLREQSVQLNPISMIANFNYVESLISFGRYEEVKEVLDHMLNIDPAHVQTVVAQSLYKYVTGEYVESIVLNDIFTNKYKNILAQFSNAQRKADIGLYQLASRILKNTAFGHYKYYYSNNIELFISEARNNLPRSETDSLGAYHRGVAELIVENYPEAIKYLKVSVCEMCDYLIYSLKKVGDEESAADLLKQRKALNNKFTNEGYGYWFDKIQSRDVFIDTDSFNIAYLEDDIEKSIHHLRNLVTAGHLIQHEIRQFPMYQKLREHPDWQTLSEISNKLATEYREAYLKLLSEKTNGGQN